MTVSDTNFPNVLGAFLGPLGRLKYIQEKALALCALTFWYLVPDVQFQALC